MFYKECGKQCGDKAKFCGKCGVKISEKPPAEEQVVKKTNVRNAVKEYSTNKGDYSRKCVNINNEI